MTPRLVQAAATGVLLAGFAADVRLAIPLVAAVLIAQLLAGPRLFPDVEARGARLNAVVEAALLVVASLALLLGHPGWAWGLAFVAALGAGLAAVADVWLSTALATARRGAGAPTLGRRPGLGPRPGRGSRQQNR